MTEATTLPSEFSGPCCVKFMAGAGGHLQSINLLGTRAEEFKTIQLRVNVC